MTATTQHLTDDFPTPSPLPEVPMPSPPPEVPMPSPVPEVPWPRARDEA